MASGDSGRKQSAGADTAQHDHKPVAVHAIWQKAGVPYEIYRTVCSTCTQVLEEQPLRRAVT